VYALIVISIGFFSVISEKSVQSVVKKTGIPFPIFPFGGMSQCLSENHTTGRHKRTSRKDAETQSVGNFPFPLRLGGFARDPLLPKVSYLAEVWLGKGNDKI
jgi:hypothetical protein